VKLSKITWGEIAKYLRHSARKRGCQGSLGESTSRKRSGKLSHATERMSKKG